MTFTWKMTNLKQSKKVEFKGLRQSSSGNNGGAQVAEQLYPLINKFINEWPLTYLKKPRGYTHD